MKRWDCRVNRMVEGGEVDAFLFDLLQVCKEHDMSLGHEDSEGGFLVRHGYDIRNGVWLLNASVDKAR